MTTTPARSATPHLSSSRRQLSAGRDVGPTSLARATTGTLRRALAPPTLAAAWTLVLLAGCAAAPPRPAATSLFGETLVVPAPSNERAAELRANTRDARARLAESPDDEDAVIWLGRRLAYEGRYREAVDVYTRGLELHPESHRLLRHRGHRFITLRDFARAEADLAAAAALAKGLPDEVESDGAPNVYDIPRSTTQSNIYYHLGLARYLRGRFDDAIRAWVEGYVHSSVNDDMLVATSWWLYLAHRRAGHSDDWPRDADDHPAPGAIRDDTRTLREWLLDPVDEDMEILENFEYHRLLLMAKGQLTPEELLPETVTSIADATLAHGVAAYLHANGEERRAMEIDRRIVAGPRWMAFGHIAAEAELWRARGNDR